MQTTLALSRLAELSAGQWGLLTTAQAAQLGISRVALARFAKAGHLERLAHGIYRDAGAPETQYDRIRAAWLSLEPERRAVDRLSDGATGVVVSGLAAAELHSIGDFYVDQFEFTTPRRRQTQRAEVKFRARVLPADAVTIVAGLPVTTVEQTLADLIEAREDFSNVAQALSDGVRAGSVDLNKLVNLLAPLAARNGLPHSDGRALLAKLQQDAGLDAISLANRLAQQDPYTSLLAGLNVLSWFPSASGISLKDFGLNFTTAWQPMQDLLRDIRVLPNNSLTEAFRSPFAFFAELESTQSAQLAKFNTGIDPLLSSLANANSFSLVPQKAGSDD
ncbi:MAG: type IV toxin-antitoxin system AbiEi family antitoxin domain-containing protein [Microbacteriaceae bacterium]